MQPPFYTIFYLTPLCSSCSPLPCTPPWVCRPLQFLHPHSPGNSSLPLVNNLVNCKIQVDLESGMCMLIAHQTAWLGALFLVIVSIFTLSGPHLSILLIFPSTLLFIIPVWRPSLRQPCLNQHSHILFLSLSIRTTNQVYSPSLSPFLLISFRFGKGPWLDTLKEAGTVLPSLILSLFWTCGCRGVAIYDRERKRPRGHTFISEIVTWKSCRVVSSKCVPPHHTSLFKALHQLSKTSHVMSVLSQDSDTTTIMNSYLQTDTINGELFLSIFQQQRLLYSHWQSDFLQ